MRKLRVGPCFQHRLHLLKIWTFTCTTPPTLLPHKSCLRAHSRLSRPQNEARHARPPLPNQRRLASARSRKSTHTRLLHFTSACADKSLSPAQVEQGSKNHELVPTTLINQIAGLRGGSAAHKCISNLAKVGLIAKVKNAKCTSPPPQHQPYPHTHFTSLTHPSQHQTTATASPTAD